eukprot:CAMPEP_0113853796 /NCGR_PEP_ID=MMETSP0372-20130328/6729_1 /TAXON_ID=340204 /ORGANISM="Lankesteria abbotti" /LENGTH=58 /DNA_ID=CAMNT_0000826425 /DNA_START=388 /DNA_END=564 /DNA_ORIENTATION=+ /assembly_acc=CAM_ASM_000359
MVDEYMRCQQQWLLLTRPGHNERLKCQQYHYAESVEDEQCLKVDDNSKSSQLLDNYPY